MTKQRRMLKLYAVLAGAIVVALVVGACGSSDPTPIVQGAPTVEPLPGVEVQPSPTPTPSGSPRRGGTLVVSGTGDAPNLDPRTGQVSVQFLHLWGQAYSQLARYNYQDPTTAIIPDLAESWEISGDNRTYTFKIRDKVKWHNGKDFTVEDAVAGVKILKNDGLRTQGELATIETIEAVNDETMRITLSAPRASLVSVLALIVSMIVSQDVLDQAGGDLKDGPTIGTGPFTQGEYIRGESVQFEKFDDYYLDGRPYLDAVRYLFIGDEGTRLAGFRAGRLDLLGPSVSDIDKVQLALLQTDVPGLSPNPYDRISSKIISVNTNRAPWSDPRVRRAAFLAIDRFEALEVLDDATRPSGPALPPGWELPNDELLSLPGYRRGADKELDREEARALLREAGFPNGFDTESITVAPVQRLVRLQVFVKDQLEKVGIRVKSSPLPFSEIVPRAVEGDYDLLTVEASVLYVDPDAFLYNIRKEVFSNILEDARTTELYRMQQAETDPAIRRDLVHQMARRNLETLGQIPIVWGQGFWPSQPKVRGFFAPVGVFIHGPRLDYVWIDE